MKIMTHCMLPRCRLLGWQLLHKSRWHSSQRPSCWSCGVIRRRWGPLQAMERGHRPILRTCPLQSVSCCSQRNRHRGRRKHCLKQKQAVLHFEFRNKPENPLLAQPTQVNFKAPNLGIHMLIVQQCLIKKSIRTSLSSNIFPPQEKKLNREKQVKPGFTTYQPQLNNFRA